MNNTESPAILGIAAAALSVLLAASATAEAQTPAPPTERRLCRIVDFGADVGGDFYRSGPMNVRKDVDVDGDGTVSPRERVAGWFFSLADPLNPRFPEYNENATSARFYGGLVGFGVGEGSISEGMNNQNHELRDDFNFMAQAWRDTDKIKAFGCYFWDKRDFLNGGDRYPVSFDERGLIGVRVSRFFGGMDDARWLVREGDTFYLSRARFADESYLNEWRGKRGTHQTHVLRPASTEWAVYRPGEPEAHDLAFDAAKADFQPRVFKNVTAVGFYIGRSRLETGSLWLKWYAFMAVANVERPARPSLLLDFAPIPARNVAGPAGPLAVPAFEAAATETPYTAWRRVYQTFVSNARCHEISPGYVFDRDGDPGSMRLGAQRHDGREPATGVTRLDALAWCNALSEYEGLTPCYYADEARTQPLRIVKERDDPARYDRIPAVYVRWDADGFRLPTAAEWLAMAAAAPRAERGADAAPSGRTHPVGAAPGEAGPLRDLRGNVWELVWDAPGDVFDPERQTAHTALGGDFTGLADPKTASPLPFGETPFEGSPRIGFRVVRGGARPPTAGPAESAELARRNAAPAWTFARGERIPPAKPAAKTPVPGLDLAAIPAGGYDRAEDGARVRISPFHLGRTEVSFATWNHVHQWAVNNGYVFNAHGMMGSFNHDLGARDHGPEEPVTDACWEDYALWCNARSEMEGRTPCYYTDAARTQVYRRALQWRVSTWQGQGYAPREVSWQPLYVRWHADGYRLPTHAEWYYAARAGAEPTPRPLEEVGWFAANSGGGTQPVGRKAADTLGLYDLEGNVSERVWDWLAFDYYRAQDPKGHDGNDMFGKPVMGSNFGHRERLPPDRWAKELPGVPRPIHGFRVARCDAGVHPEEEKLELPVVLDADPARFDPQTGRTARANLMRTGVFEATGAPNLAGALWTVETGGPVRAGPVVVEGVLYVGSLDGTVRALDAKTGAPIWTFEAGKPVRAAVAVADGRVFAGSDNQFFYALDAKTGAVLWKYRGRAASATAPAVAYGLVFAGFGYGWSGQLVGLDPADGTEKWRYRLGGINTLPGGVSMDGERVYAPAGDIAVFAADLRTEYRVWHASGTPTRASMPVVGETVYYAAEGRVMALDRRTGERRWMRYRPDKGQTTLSERENSCSPAATPQAIYLGWRDGAVTALSADDGRELWKFQTGGPVESSPAIGGQTLYVGSNDGQLYALDLDTGAERARFKTGGPVRSSPWIGDGVVYIGSDDGRIYAIR